MKSWIGRMGVTASMLAVASGCGPQDRTDPGTPGAQAESADWTPLPLPPTDDALPDARRLLQTTSAFIGSQTELLMEAAITYGAVQESGQTLHFDVIERLALRRPDRLAWVTLHDDGSLDWAWLSGGTFSLLKEPANMWGSVSVPHAIPAAVDRLVTEYDLDVPFQDLLASVPGERWLAGDVTAVEYVGEEWVQGAWTDHVALRKPGVDLELWIHKGEEPFPARMMVVFTEEPGRPSYTARFRRWSTSLPDGDATFAFTPPADAQPVDVAPVARP